MANTGQGNVNKLCVSAGAKGAGQREPCAFHVVVLQHSWVSREAQLPVDCRAFAQFANPQQPNAVLMLKQAGGATTGQLELRAYATGFKRWVAYFRRAENRGVAQAFSRSLRAAYGNEVAEAALKKNGFSLFETLGKPLHTRRVQAIFSTAEAELRESRQHNRTLTEQVSALSAAGSPNDWLDRWKTYRENVIRHAGGGNGAPTRLEPDCQPDEAGNGAPWRGRNPPAYVGGSKPVRAVDP